MKAVVLEEFGAPDVLHVKDVDVPEPGHGQVRIKVQAAGVAPFDSGIRSGALQRDFPTPLPTILGTDVAGIVDAVGEGVTGITPGEEVLGWADAPWGSYAQYALATSFAVKPEGLSFADAATLPVAADATRRALDLLRVGSGDTVLIHGAAGSVGTIAVQVAKSRGATVVGTAGESNQDYLRSLGAIPTTYGDGLVDRVRDLVPEVDAVFDIAGKGVLEDSMTLRNGTDRIVSIGDPNAPKLGVAFSSSDPQERSSGRLEQLAQAAADGDLRPLVSATYPLERAAAAQRANESGHGRGKIILTI